MDAPINHSPAENLHGAQASTGDSSRVLSPTNSIAKSSNALKTANKRDGIAEVTDSLRNMRTHDSPPNNAEEGIIPDLLTGQPLKVTTPSNGGMENSGGVAQDTDDLIDFSVPPPQQHETKLETAGTTTDKPLGYENAWAIQSPQPVPSQDLNSQGPSLSGPNLGNPGIPPQPLQAAQPQGSSTTVTPVCTLPPPRTGRPEVDLNKCYNAHTRKYRCAYPGCT